jgi:hypothetical protein
VTILKLYQAVLRLRVVLVTYLGVMISASSGAPLATFYDNTAGSGTKIFECIVPTGNPVIVFFPTRFAIKFETGLYLSLAANLTATVWTREFGVTT